MIRFSPSMAAHSAVCFIALSAVSDSHPLKIFKQTLSNHNPPAFRYSITSHAITVVIYRSEEMSNNLLTIKILIHPSEINLFDVGSARRGRGDLTEGARLKPSFFFLNPNNPPWMKLQSLNVIISGLRWLKMIVKYVSERSTIVIICGKSSKDRKAQVAQSRAVISKQQCRLVIKICASLFCFFFFFFSLHPQTSLKSSHITLLSADRRGLRIQIKCKSVLPLWARGKISRHLCRSRTLPLPVSHRSTPPLLSVKLQKRLDAAGVGCGSFSILRCFFSLLSWGGGEPPRGLKDGFWVVAGRVRFSAQFHFFFSFPISDLLLFCFNTPT